MSRKLHETRPIKPMTKSNSASDPEEPTLLSCGTKAKEQDKFDRLMNFVPPMSG